MWASSFYDLDPVKELLNYTKQEKIQLDYVFNLSASPFVIGKNQKRMERGIEISHLFKAPFFYVNRVGGEDEILFDGNSFVVNGNEKIISGKRFKSDRLSIPVIEEKGKYLAENKLSQAQTWEELFQANLSFDDEIAKVQEWDDNTCQEVLEALCFGFQEYAKKSGFMKFTIALSGGMDSALVLTMMTLSLSKDQYIEAIYMPSIHSSPLSFELSLALCKNLNIPLKSLPIKFLHSATKNLFGQTYPESFEGLTDENVQSRIRGMLLYTRSNQLGSMVVNTSNKSELAVGYSTQYGDSVGAISLLGDIYKSQVYRLAEYINKKFNHLIPEKIITREPSAELRDGQVDTQTLPPYERLDAILEGILNYRYTKDDLVKMNLPEEEVEKTLNMYKRNEYKRYQFCPIIKVSSKSFGFGYRVPLTKHTGFYNQ
jgi:NAD+ synthase (glutamine-hydrolysing)